MLQKLLLMGSAGAVGVWARYGLAGLVQRMAGEAFPWGTAVVNVTGCFIAGVLFVLFESRFMVSAETRLIVLVGFLGSFTTFSTFALETGNLMRDAQWAWAAGNLALHNACGLACFFLGTAIGRLI